MAFTDRRRRWIGRGTLALLWLGTVAVAPAAAQLISPGQLSRPHAQLEGLRNCTKCHELGKPGIANVRCLDCHTHLATELAQHRGFHAPLATKNCAECHKEHFGRDFTLVRFDTTGFDHHARTSYALQGAHATLACRKCHTPALIADTAIRRVQNTFAGLGTTCRDCHTRDDPHGRQFATRACTDCHTQDTWKTAPRFDHAATRFPLTGRHADVRCRECHRPMTPGVAASARYAGLSFARCQDCHTDPHRGKMGGDCTRCHVTDGWGRLDRSSFERHFDHATTGYKLVAAHATLACADCHDRAKTWPDSAGIALTFRTSDRGRPYPRPRAADCLSCHRDYHGGAFRTVKGGMVCSNCHTERAWTPTTFDVRRHAATGFVLTGSHLAVPCRDCHQDARGGWRFRLADTTCAACHTETNPHGQQFAGRSCDACHDVDSFRIAAFDHSHTRFPLDGRHRDVPCASCHKTRPGPHGKPMRIYEGLGTTCDACHGGVG
ncbi:MAG TPA: hypothetical protein VJ992_03060 [Gemmatimonadales bacterium]|nr:hypothetical protein [Gemmatimonadales bacterium]